MQVKVIRRLVVLSCALTACALECRGVEISKLETVQRENGLVDINYTLASSDFDWDVLSSWMNAEVVLVRPDGVELDCSTFTGGWNFSNGTHTVTWNSKADGLKDVAGLLTLRLWSSQGGSISYSSDQPPAWSVDSAVKYGSYSYVRRSNAIGNSASTDWYGTLWGPGTMTFAWKVSSELNYDTLSYYVDGACKKTISGLTNWETVRIEVTDSGAHRIRFRYSKDGSVARNEDCGWIGPIKLNTGFLKAEQGTYYLRSVTVTDETKTLADITGGYQSQVTNVVIANGVTRLPAGFGSGADNVRSVKIEDYDDLESGCSLKNWFPSAYSKIEALAFGYGNYTIYGVPSQIPSALIDGCTSLKTVGAPICQTIGGNTWTYTLTGGEATVGSGSYLRPAVLATTTGAVTIPSILWGCPVTGLSRNAFYGCAGITSVSIPDTVRRIGEWAFRGCGALTHVDMPESLETMDRCAFCGCDKLHDIVLSDAITNIAYSAFYDCSNLVSVTIGESVRAIGEDAFKNCVSLANVSFSPKGPCRVDKKTFDGCTTLISDSAPYRIAGPILLGYNGTCPASVVIPNGVKVVAAEAFENCWDISSVKFPEGLIDINDNSFSCCNGIEELDFPDSLRSVGKFAFYRREYARSDYAQSQRTPADRLRTVRFGSGKIDMGEYAFAERTNLLSVASSGRLEVLGRNAFYGDKALERFVAEKGVGSVGKYAFMTCESLAEFSAFSDTTEIGEHAFQGCGLTEVVLPATLREVKQGAFCYCTSLVSAKFLGDDVIFGSTETYGEGWWCGIFEECTNLREVRIPGHVKHIPSDCFARCSSLQSVTIPTGVTNIMEHAFSGCSSMSEIMIPDGVIDIGDYAFSRCEGLTELVVPNSVVTIGGHAFSSCDGLRTVDIGAGVTTIGDDAFNYGYSHNLESIRFRGNAPKTGSDVASYVADGFAYLVSKGSTGWGVSIPGTWKNRPIRYVYHTIAFDVNGGDDSLPALECDDGSALGALPEPTRAGYSFAGWHRTGDIRVTSGYVPTENMLLTAKWTINSYAITYANTRGKTVANPSSYTVADAVTFEPLPDDGDWRFVTWIPSKLDVGSTDNVTVSACWARVSANYAPVLPWQDGSETVRIDYEIESDIDLSLLSLQLMRSNGLHTNEAWNVFWNDAAYYSYWTDYSGALTNGAHAGTYYIGNEYGVDLEQPVSLGLKISGGIGQERVQSSWSCSGAFYGDYIWDAGNARYSDRRECTEYLSGSGEISFRWDWYENSYDAVATFYIDGEAVASCCGWRDGTRDVQTFRLGPGRHTLKWDFYNQYDDSAYVDVRGISWKPDFSARIDIRTEMKPLEIPLTEYAITYQDEDGMDNPNPKAFTKNDAIVFVPLADHDNRQFVRWEPAAIAKGTKGNQTVRAVWKDLYLKDMFGEGLRDVSTDGKADWFVTRDQGNWVARSGEIGNRQLSVLTAKVDGIGRIAFCCKVSSECDVDDGMPYDGLQFLVDGIDMSGLLGGETGWTDRAYDIAKSGEHVLQWKYSKDKSDSMGEDCAWLWNVTWTPFGPTVEGDPGAVVTGDAESGYTVKPSAGKTAVEVTIPAGVDAKKVTVEVGTNVETVKPNGAKVKVVKGGSDITAYLDIPAADAGGAVDLTKATVKEEIVKEALDPEKGAKITLEPSNVKLQTSNTRPGLTYTFSEGMTLEGLTQKSSKTGDGSKWTPTITVKGGTSGFYSIGVKK